jgi:hypothetical protein
VEPQPTLLISLSKGAADLKHALQEDPDCLCNVPLWVSIGGIFHGTPIVNSVEGFLPLRWINRLVFRLRKRDYRFFSQLATGPSGSLENELRLPSGVELIHAVAFPLRRHATSPYARLWHGRFARNGPNDSVLMLEQLLRLPGKILPIWGADHYYSTRWDFRGLVRCMLSYWDSHVGQPMSLTP